MRLGQWRIISKTNDDTQIIAIVFGRRNVSID
jgi:mRNA-degrading endonuclease RelE of RelBE toxin-antitoxin system